MEEIPDARGRSMKAVLFDLDNTLLLEDEATERALLAAAYLAHERLGVEPRRLARAAARVASELFRASPAFAYAEAIGVSGGEALWGTFAGEGPGLRALREHAPGFRIAVWTGALVRVGARAALAGPLPGELSAAFIRARTSGQLEDPAAAGVLDALAGRYRLALVTNGAPDVQRTKLAGTALGSRFEVVIISGELGLGKPDPAPIRAALEALGVAAADAAMVGDSRARDVGSARAAGVCAILLERRGPAASARLGDPARGGPRPDAWIRDLRELPALLDGLARRPASLPGSPGARRV